jgi:DNA-binding NarL/FixJ family response regulator
MAAATLDPVARVLAAADVYQSMIEPRPHRPARSSEDAARELRAEARAGRLDGASVDAVLASAGLRVHGRRQWPAGLTPREIEVLVLVARGKSSKDVASALAMSPKTARNHTEHIYSKIGASSRVEASLFAIKHGLLGVPAPSAGRGAVAP